MRVCAVAGCGQPSARPLCETHRSRKRIHGDVRAEIPVDRALPRRERFWTRVDKSGECWLWVGSLDQDGYGKYGRPTMRAHIFAYTTEVGPVPDGLELDHLCRNRRCVRPLHLEPVTNAVNVLRGEGPSAMNARKIQCDAGHPFDSENTYMAPSGKRVCRTCVRAAGARYRDRQRGAQ